MIAISFFAPYEFENKKKNEDSEEKHIKSNDLYLLLTILKLTAIKRYLIWC